MMGSIGRMEGLGPIGQVRLMEFLRLCQGYTLEDLEDEARLGNVSERFGSTRGDELPPYGEWLKRVAEVLLWDEKDRDLLFVIIDGDAALERFREKLDEHLERQRRLAVEKLDEYLGGPMGVQVAKHWDEARMLEDIGD